MRLYAHPKRAKAWNITVKNYEKFESPREILKISEPRGGGGGGGLDNHAFS